MAFTELKLTERQQRGSVLGVTMAAYKIRHVYMYRFTFRVDQIAVITGMAMNELEWLLPGKLVSVSIGSDEDLGKLAFRPTGDHKLSSVNLNENYSTFVGVNMGPHVLRTQESLPYEFVNSKLLVLTLPSWACYTGQPESNYEPLPPLHELPPLVDGKQQTAPRISKARQVGIDMATEMQRVSDERKAREREAEQSRINAEKRARAGKPFSMMDGKL